MANKYREYFDIDEEYFPQINDYSIAAASPDFWTRTYPHQTFIDMLSSMERVLARQEKRSLWIEGAYGTGKSQCSYALKKILEVPEEELRAYWNRYEPLKKKPDLLEKLVGHKQKGIVTAHRYASGGIGSPRDLFLAVQDSIRAALIEQKLYAGENTLKESVIAWIDEPSHKLFFDALLQKPEWSALFSQSTAEEVLKALRKGGEVKMLMDNLFRLADKEGITALNIDADRLLAWLTDIIDQNNVKIVFIWDEFSDYFKNNRESLSEFQKLAELVNLKPFYFIVVTHESGQLFTTADTTWTKVRDRFIPVQITLPDNIAFNLIGHAFNVKQAAKSDWDKWADDLNSRVSSSRTAVMKAAKITEPQVMKDIMPLHPMAALLLKNIASAFKSNQRSMFDFIKSPNAEDVKAFQWFIENTGPFDDHPLLTVDMLWNFFYEKGRDNLTADIRLILDTFPQQQNLREDEKAVLKAILIMQAIDQRLGGTIDLFKATEQNLSYVFEGITSGLDVSCKNIAKQLVTKGILVSNPISGGRYVFTAAVLAGDQAKIDGYKKEIRQNSTTSKLVTEGGLSTVLSLSPALRLRFESEPNTGKITPVTTADFTRTINNLRDKPTGWKFHAVIAFAKDDAEAISFRKTIKAAVADKQYENIVFIDALSTPLGIEAFEQYVDYSAMAMYYNGNNNSASRESSDKARHVLDQDWKNCIYNGQFIVYTYANQEGEKLGNGQGVASVLQTIVTARFPLVFDFAKGLSENQFKLTNGKASAKSGILQSTSGVMVGVEKHVLHTVWKVDKYWEVPPTATLSISKIKVEVDKLIEDAFNRDGQISIDEIYDFLEEKYGFAPCNLSAFFVGFLLKEYGGEPFRYSDSSGGHESMTQDKLAEMLGNHIGKTPKPTYIVKMTAEEMAFYELTEKAWGIAPNSCSSAGQAAIAVTAKMRGLGLPVWCLAEVDDYGVYNVVQKYIELVQKEGNEAHKKAVEIGNVATVKTTLPENLAAFLTGTNCQKGMREFLTSFEGGKILSLATEIGASGNVLADIRALFAVKHSCLWDKQTGEDEIRKLLTDYGVVKESNILLNVTAHSRSEAFKEWRERLKFIGVSCEALRAKFPSLTKVLDALLKIYQQSDVLPDQLKMLLSELTAHSVEIRNLLNNEKQIFTEVYAPYLDDLSDSDISEVKSKLPTGMFELQKTDCNAKVKTAAEEFRKNQLKTQLFNLWKEKTGTKTPREWSSHYRTPILCCVSENEFGSAKKAFDTLNRKWSTDAEIKSALAFLETTSLFGVLSDESKRNAAFERGIVGEYRALLPNPDKVRDALDRLSVDTYEWLANPSVKNKVKQLAEAEYNAGGSDKALMKIDEMDDSQLKQYLKGLVRKNMTVGIKIITNGGKADVN
ncbi:hypothetical protein SAMN05660649_00012 [Desulfotomaculum arcticum]|uniref:Uncharacterized protein n=1 Tax=Desulfotruncus arcticus DSM 17038 TaxID=1121424 RepID=A0A1I2MLN3_9FIRM|nr:hypothetical protein [Desulfotruncus arcticus]SFF92363.1 hypothetical protein SAMN05660649_00012 [Desulfotomaculum arcticum] [Desulfotruncus arcticus DSM 17038]